MKIRHVMVRQGDWVWNLFKEDGSLAIRYEAHWPQSIQSMQSYEDRSRDNRMEINYVRVVDTIEDFLEQMKGDPSEVAAVLALALPLIRPQLIELPSAREAVFAVLNDVIGPVDTLRFAATLR